MSGGNGLHSDDLLRDEPLAKIAAGAIGPELDVLHHRVAATTVAQVIGSAQGSMNIALFGPWGSGKTSFYGLVEEELKRIDKKALVVRFDAWANAGEGFQANFLSTLSAGLGRGDSDTATLFKSRKTVSFLSIRQLWANVGFRGFLIALVASFLVIGIAGPVLWGALFPPPKGPWFSDVPGDIKGWLATIFPATVVVFLIGVIVDIARVSVDEAVASHSVEFGEIFNRIVQAADHRVVVFVDELDRCAPVDVIRTLEGLRTFLTHDRCTFAVAFDREAIAKTISRSLPNEVVERADQPYYSTAGEYLDKIFQFQISLPPQTQHTFRRFALRLVEGRAGIWGAMRDIDTTGSALERVVAILSPIHLSSPRRTKVLLNDFAVNARMFEAMGFDWRTRREEIAALTVMRTEFPGFASNLLRVPTLPWFVTGQRHPKSALAIALTQLYAPVAKSVPMEVGPAIDEIVVGQPSSEESASARASEVDRIEGALVDNLRRFLTRLADLGVKFPGADLVLMHDDQGLIAFDDPEIYAALVAAADAPNEETMAALASAGPDDRVRAVSFLLQQVEGETYEAKEQLLEIAGRITFDLPQIDEIATEFSASLAFLDSPSRESLGQLSTRAVSGMARATTRSAATERLGRILDLASSNRALDRAEILGVAIGASVAGSSTKVREELKRRSIGLLRDVPTALSGILQVEDGWPSDERLSNEDVDAAVSALLPRKKPPVAADSTSAASIQKAQEATDSNEAEFLAQEELAEQSAQTLLDQLVAQELSDEVSEWAIRLFVAIGERKRWGEPQAAAAIARFGGQIEAGRVNSILFEAIESDPQTASFWISQLQEDDSAPAEAAGAIRALIEIALSSASDADELSEANAAISRITSHLPSGYGVGGLAEKASEMVDFTSSTSFAAAFLRYPGALAVSRIESDRAKSLDWEVGYLEFLIGLAATASDFSELGGAIDDASLQGLERLSSRFESISSGTPSRAALLLTTHLRVNRRLRDASVSRTYVTRAEYSAANGSADQPALLRDWLSDGASFADVMATPEAAVQVQTDASIAEGLAASWSQPERTGAWNAAVAAGADPRILSRIAQKSIERASFQPFIDDFASSSSPDVRARAARLLGTLSLADTEARAAVVACVIAAKEHFRSQDLKYAVGLLLPGRARFSDAERARIRAALQPWVERHPGALSKRDIEQLQDSSMLPKRRTWLEQIFGSRS